MSLQEANILAGLVVESSVARNWLGYVAQIDVNGVGSVAVVYDGAVFNESRRGAQMPDWGHVMAYKDDRSPSRGNILQLAKAFDADCYFVIGHLHQMLGESKKRRTEKVEAERQERGGKMQQNAPLRFSLHAALSPVAKELQTMVHFLSGHARNQFLQSAYPLADRVSLLGGQDDAGVRFPWDRYCVWIR